MLSPFPVEPTSNLQIGRLGASSPNSPLGTNFATLDQPSLKITRSQYLQNLTCNGNGCYFFGKDMKLGFSTIRACHLIQVDSLQSLCTDTRYLKLVLNCNLTSATWSALQRGPYCFLVLYNPDQGIGYLVPVLCNPDLGTLVTWYSTTLTPSTSHLSHP